MKRKKMDRIEMNTDKSSSSSNMRRNTESQGCLPDDLVIMIFLCLPADLLYNVMRFVCKHWYNIIQSPSFISSHLQNSRSGLCIIRNNQGHQKSYILKPISNHGCGVELKEVNFRRDDMIMASCNGLVFVLGPQCLRNHTPCYVANLVTKQYLPLPLIPDDIWCGKWHLAYVAASRVYKVFFEGYNKPLILTVGVDKGCRKVNISELTYSDIQLSSTYSICVGGFLYWVETRRDPFLLCFDMETESFRHHFPHPPQFYHMNYFDGRIFAMGSSLCLYNRVDNYSFDMWLLKDPQTGHGKWEKLLNVNLEAHDCHPCGWLRSGELLVLKSPGSVLVYNVKTGEFSKPEQINNYSSISYAHVESLVPINNLSLMTTGRPNKIRISRSKFYSKDIMKAEFEELSSC